MSTAAYYGYNPPFYGGPQGVLSRQTDEQLIKNDILQAVLTSPGERVYRAGYGSLLRTAVFQSLTDADLSVIQQSIIQVISLDERVRVNSVVLTLSNDRQTLQVAISVNLVANPLTTYFIEFNIDASGTIKLLR